MENTTTSSSLKSGKEAVGLNCTFNSQLPSFVPCLPHWWTKHQDKLWKVRQHSGAHTGAVGNLCMWRENQNRKKASSHVPLWNKGSTVGDWRSPQGKKCTRARREASGLPVLAQEEREKEPTREKG